MKFNQNWQNVELGPGRTLFMASDFSLHSVPSEFLWQAREIDPDLVVLADSPEGWQEFVREQTEAERQWNLRQAFTTTDWRMLREMGIAWDEPSLEDSIDADGHESMPNVSDRHRLRQA